MCTVYEKVGEVEKEKEKEEEEEEGEGEGEGPEVGMDQEAACRSLVLKWSGPFGGLANWIHTKRKLQGPLLYTSYTIYMRQAVHQSKLQHALMTCNVGL